MAVDDALRASLNEEVGVEHVESLGEISATLTRRYAAAVGERDPLYHDAQYAQSLGYANVVAPLNFLPGVICWTEGAPYDRLREDGTEADTHLPGVPAKGVRVMGGGEEMHFTRPVVAGTVVTRRTVLLDVADRESRQGTMLVARYADLYVDEGGDELLRSVRTVLLR
ncbi:MAG: MaoC family dehydratase N-terminal domain-containing protein [Acidimicrobiales bacterium]